MTVRRWSVIVGGSILFVLVLGCPTSFAALSETLSISGPSDGVSAENITLLITLDDEPVQARVYFEGTDSISFSNATTGMVTLTLPVVQSYQSFLVNASLASGLYSLFTINVTPLTQSLHIDILPYPVDELNTFTVYVTDDRGFAVHQAKVYFDNTVDITNASGMVSFTAPDILVTSNYGLVVNKSGYESNTTFLTVHEAGAGEQLLVLIAPSIVEPLTLLTVQCSGLHGGIEDVQVRLWYEEQMIANYTTTNSGRVSFNAPFLNILNYCTIEVEKEGYATYDDTDEIQIWLVPRDENISLVLTPSSSEITENSLLTLTVENEDGEPVEDALIWRGLDAVEESTDAQGVLIINVPQVFFDQEMYLFALKEGYAFAQSLITVRDMSQENRVLVVDVDDLIYETEPFLVMVTDSGGRPIADAAVVFGAEEQRTTVQGVATFIAPEVLVNTSLAVEVSKYGFQSVTTSAYIVDLDGSSGDHTSSLTIYVAERALEYEQVLVTVKDQEGTLIQDAVVWFNEQQKTTNEQGQVSFTAFEVAWDTTADITAIKQGYTSDAESIVIVNVDGFSYWMILFIITVVVIVGGVAFYRSRFL